MNKLNYRRRPLVTAVLVGLALSACGGAPKKVDSLEDARAAYQRASNDPTVAKHAPKELDAAKLALGKAERSWKDEEKPRIVERDANLASKRVMTAELIAKSREADRRIESMKLERKEVQLALRGSEIDRAQARAEKTRLENEALQRQMKELKAQQTERGMVLTLGDVLFASGQAELEPGAARNIAKIASFMKDHPERQAVVEGHTDSVGQDDFNMDLSRERAFAVRQALVRQGVAGHRISTQGFGKAVPVASNRSPDGRQRNRRVEVIFPDAPGQVSELDR